MTFSQPLGTPSLQLQQDERLVRQLLASGRLPSTSISWPPGASTVCLEVVSLLADAASDSHGCVGVMAPRSNQTRCRRRCFALSSPSCLSLEVGPSSGCRFLTCPSATTTFTPDSNRTAHHRLHCHSIGVIGEMTPAGAS